MLKEGINILYKNDLKQLIESDLFAQLKHVPISKIRALSQINNPRLCAEKPLLLVDFIAGEVAGYLGAYHDYIIIDNEKIPVGWANDLWVNPTYRGHGLAGNLIVELYTFFEGNLMVADYVPDTFHIYDSKGLFSKIKPIEGKRIFLQKPDKEWIDQRFGDSIKKTVFNTFLKLRPKTPQKIAAVLYNINTINTLKTEHENYINTTTQNTLFNYGISEWNHWLSEPWLSETETEPRFHFSTHSNPFKQFCVELRDPENNLKALLFLMRRNNELKVKQIYTTPDMRDEVLKTIIYTAQNMECKQILIYDTHVLANLSKFSAHYIFAANSKKHLLCGNDLYNCMRSAQIQISDGDLAFT